MSLCVYNVDYMFLIAPEVAPVMCTGCFTDVPCKGPDCRDVIVYWQVSSNTGCSCETGTLREGSEYDLFIIFYVDAVLV